MISQMSPASETSCQESPTAFPFSAEQLPTSFGRYELIEVLGVGGMGTVYLAHDSTLQRRVALKIPHRAVDRVLMRRLFDEARAAATISHPNVCSLYDIGCEAGYPFLTMECVEGTPLDRLVSQGKPMPAKSAVKIIIKIAAGLHAAHQQGVIHRDLKPANILMRHGTDPVITDFGLAHRSGMTSRHRCGGKILGSPAYMSPEQVRGEENVIGPATDVYGLGTILYELITGQRPFDGHVPTIYSQVLTQMPLAPSQIASGIDQRLDEICMRALSKSSNDRYADVLAFAQSLTEYLRISRSHGNGVSAARPCVPKRARAVCFSESRASHQPFCRREPARMDTAIAHIRRWQRSVAGQQSGFVSGFLLAAILAIVSLIGFGLGNDAINAMDRFASPSWRSTTGVQADEDAGKSTGLRANLQPTVRASTGFSEAVETVKTPKARPSQRYGRATDRDEGTPVNVQLTSLMADLGESIMDMDRQMAALHRPMR